ncbi:MAG: VanZ family protein [Cellvibrionaceae bacterium]|jgi:VanZ family protein
MKKYTWASFVFSLFLVVIIYMANTGSNRLLGYLYTVPNFDKIGHFVLFGALAFFVNRALGCKKTNLFGNIVLVGSMWVISFVVLEEVSQIFIATRNFSISDLMYDMVGIYIGGFMAVVTSQPVANLKALAFARKYGPV